jgi:hypothetical protein
VKALKQYTVLAVFFVGLVAFFTLCFTLILRPGPALDCAPVNYSHGGWYNAAGQQVAVAPTEDSVLHYVGACR